MIKKSHNCIKSTENMKIIKFLVTLFFLATSYWVTYLIFERNFMHAGMQYSADSWNENTLMILLTSTAFSAIGVLCLGVLSMFTHFVFIKLIYADEIKQAAYFYVKNKRREDLQLTEFHKSVRMNELSKAPFKKFLYKVVSFIMD